MQGMNDQFHEFEVTTQGIVGARLPMTNELAWNRADAVEAIDRLEKAGFTCWCGLAANIARTDNDRAVLGHGR